MFCLKCGKELPDEAVFCLYCGQKITVKNSEQSSVLITAEKQVNLITPGNNLPVPAGIKKHLTSDEMYCRSCGNIIRKEAEVCPKCGVNREKPIISDDVYCQSCGEKIKSAAEVCPLCGVRQTIVKGKGNGFPNASLVFGLTSIIPFAGFVCGILGLIFSIKTLRIKKYGKAIAGLIVSFVGILFNIMCIIGVIVV